MGMTMTQKILAAHAGLDHVEAGQLIMAKLDIVMANDITGPMALPIFRQMADKVFDKIRLFWYQIILHRTKILSQQRTPRQFVSLRRIRVSAGILNRANQE